jgi:hypothetical protein
MSLDGMGARRITLVAYSASTDAGSRKDGTMEDNMVVFTLIVEDPSAKPSDKLQHKLELVNLRWVDSPPDVVVMPGGLMLTKIGIHHNSTNKGVKYKYKIADVSYLVEGKLEPKYA